MVQSIECGWKGTYKLGIAPYGYKLVDRSFVEPDEARNIEKS
ncbi:MAG: hypothetical protein ACLU3R_06410 [Acutalibacteraceae bacterium]